MPNYVTHSIVNIGLASPLSIIAYKGILENRVTLESAACFFVGYTLSTFVLSPDLDLATSQIAKNWGRLKFLSWGYSKVFHHGQFSHRPVLGTLSRYVYVFLILFILAWMVSVGGFSLPLDFLKSNGDWVGWAFFGSCCADIVHWFLDITTTYHKKK